MFSNRKWIIITLADYTTDQLEELISNAIQTSSSTLRKSIDGTKAILKWDGDTPSVFDGMTTYNHTQIKTTLATSAWTSEDVE
mgnify:FL=1|tara:strand:+ start:3798 stop:4046 length:249 start_codon:yes stop_codon:yes gene_type:complete